VNPKRAVGIAKQSGNWTLRCPIRFAIAINVCLEVLNMRVMDILSFPHLIEIRDLETLFAARLNQEVVMWPCQAIPLLGYMCYPNDEAARSSFSSLLRSWSDFEGPGQPPVPPKLGRIQSDWLKVADIFHSYCDLIDGQHQERRGGPSIGKAITLVAANAKSRGTGEANLWKLWADYKDVAHLVTAATLVCAEVRTRLRGGSPRLNPTQFVAFPMAFLMPDLVLAVAQEFEHLGRAQGSDPRSEPALDPHTYWRIPNDINVAPLPPPPRKLRLQDIKVLNERRAGNRGRANKTTPVSD
jgi:hypothetical protein